MRNNINTFPDALKHQISLQSVLEEDCSRRADGLLCQGNENTKQYDDTLQEKELAILFLDIRNFTGLLQVGNQYQMVQLLNKVLNLFSRVIEGFGGKLVDRAGDNLYAVFGLHNDIAQAANAASESADMLFELLAHLNKQYFEVRFGQDLRIGVGIHAGRVIINSASNGFGFSVMGLAVNLAARLQAETKNANNDLLLSNDLYMLLYPAKIKSHWEHRDSVQLKGIEQPQAIWLAGRPYINLPAANAITDDFLYWLSIAG